LLGVGLIFEALLTFDVETTIRLVFLLFGGALARAEALGDAN
jgi:hypothetical protein